MHLCEQTRCVFYLIEVMQGDPYSLRGQKRFIRQVIAPYHDLHALHILFTQTKCLSRRVRKGGGRRVKGSRTTELRPNPEKAIFGCSYLRIHQPVRPAAKAGEQSKGVAERGKETNTRFFFFGALPDPPLPLPS